MFRTLMMASACVASLLCAMPAIADDASRLLNEARRTDRIAAAADGGTVAERIAADFPGTFGTPEETRALIADLRSGTAQGKARGTMGYGEIYISLALAQAYAASNSLAPAGAMEQILAQRVDGKGWGKIALDLGIKLGPVVARLRSGNERLDGAAQRASRADRASAPERPMKPERPQRLERPDRPERGGRS